jgi:hypothetical protein
MPLTEQHTQRAGIIDTHVSHVLSHGRGDEELLLSFAQYMGPVYGSCHQITSHAYTKSCYNFLGTSAQTLIELTGDDRDEHHHCSGGPYCGAR